jgi:hypothetical protein
MDLSQYFSDYAIGAFGMFIIMSYCIVIGYLIFRKEDLRGEGGE